MPERIAIIADDLTGANDTAVQFWKQGFATVVMIGAAGLEEALASAEVVALNLDSRVDMPEAAAQKVHRTAAALRQAGVTRIYKKIDSTLRGNLGAETDALIDEMELPAAVVTPAFPATGRAVIGGYLVVNGELVTEVVRDERVSAARGSLPALLASQSRFPVAALELPEVSGGVEALTRAMTQAMQGGARVLAADASTEEHLQTIVRAADAAGTGGLLVGSGGLASALAAGLAAATGLSAPLAPPCGQASDGGQVLVLAGSYSAVTAQQVEVAAGAGAIIVELDLGQALGYDTEAAVQAAAHAAASALRSDHSAIVRPAGGLQPGAELRVADLMAEVAQRVMALVPLIGLALTGGDIAMAACRRLEATSIAVVGEVAPGLPAGRLQGGSLSGLYVVTKAGAFGEQDALHRAIEWLSTAVPKTQ